MAACGGKQRIVEEKSDGGEVWCTQMLRDKEAPYKYDPKFTPKRITIQEATKKELIVFVLVGQPGVGKSFFFNMLCRKVRHETGNSAGAGKALNSKPDLVQISRSSCIIDTMGMLDCDPDSDKEARALMNTILGAGLKRVRLIFLTDTRNGRLPREITIVVDELLEAIDNESGEKASYSLFLTKVPNEFLMDTNKKIEFEAKVLKCWENCLDDWSEGLQPYPFMLGVCPQFQTCTENKQVPQLLESLWDWLHLNTCGIEIDPDHVKKLEKLDKERLKKKLREMQQTIKAAEKDKKALKAKAKQLKEEVYNNKVDSIWKGIGLKDVGCALGGAALAGGAVMMAATPVGWVAGATYAACTATASTVLGKAVRYGQLEYPSDDEKKN